MTPADEKNEAWRLLRAETEKARLMVDEAAEVFAAARRAYRVAEFATATAEQRLRNARIAEETFLASFRK